MRMVQRRWVKLIKFQIGDPTAGSPGHCNTIPGRDVRVGRILINLRCAAGRQHHSFCAAGLNRFFITVPDPGSHNAPRSRQADFIGENQINGVAALQHPDIRVGQRLAHQGGLYGFPGRIGGVEDTAVTVPPFARQVIARFAVCLYLSIEQNALIDKPLNAGFSVARNKGDRMAIAKTRSGNQRIFDVGFNAVGFIKHGGDAALRIESRPFTNGAFAENGDRTAFRQAQGER